MALILALGILSLIHNQTKFANAQTADDLALNKPISGVSSTAEGSSPANAVDGNAGTYWTAGGGGAQWLGVDLGSVYTVGNIAVKWGADKATSYSIEISNDGINYTPVLAGIDGDFNSAINE